METERPIYPLMPEKKLEPGQFGKGKLAICRSRNHRPHNHRPVGAGLENLGNTCFLNSVLQCVSHTVPLLLCLQSPPHPYPCSSYRGDLEEEEARFCSICALQQHVAICMRDDATIIKPCGFVNNLRNISSSFSRYQQEDAQEFLHCLLDHLHSSCFDGDERASANQKSIISNLFGGRLRSQVHCSECGHRSDTYEPFLNLSLEIEEAYSVEEALESFTKVERIDDPEIKLTCEGCKARVFVEKQFMLDLAPPVLALHLKRFKSNGYLADKIDKFIKYPTILDLKPFHANPKSQGVLEYDLYAAVMHQGSSSLYGHYYCFVRPDPDSWFIMDDEKVLRVDEEDALGQKAYILFYVQRGTSWFSSFVEDVMIGQRTSPVSVLEHSLSSSSDGEERPCSVSGGSCSGGDEREVFDGGETSSPEVEREECGETSPSTPKQDRKEEPEFHDQAGEEAEATPRSYGGRERAVAGSCLRLMPKARRQRLEEFMGPSPCNDDKRGIKKPKAQPETTTPPTTSRCPLPSSLLHRIVASQEETSDLVLSGDQ